MLLEKIKRILDSHKQAILFLLPILCIFFVFREPLIKGMFSNGDALFSFFGYFYFYAKGSSLIAYSIISGFPVFVSSAGIWFYPVTKFFLLFFEPARAYTILSVFNIVLTYVFTFLYLRRINLSYYTSVISAVIATFSGQLMLWSETLTNTNYFWILPLVFLIIEKGNSSNNLWRKILFIAISGLVAGIAWVSGHVQFALYISTFSSLYIIFKNINIFVSKLKSVFCICSFILVFSISAFVVGFPQIHSILNYKAVSVRSEGVSAQDYFLGAYEPQEIVRFVVPFFSVDKIPWSNPNIYIGLIPFLILILGIIHRKKFLDRSTAKFFFWLMLFCYVASIKYSPIGYILHNLPFFDSLREAPRIMFIGQFAQAVFLGFVIDKLFKYPYDLLKNARLIKVIKALSTIFICLVSVGTILFIYRDSIAIYLKEYFLNNLYSSTSGLPISHYFSYIDNLVFKNLKGVSIFDHQLKYVFIFSILILSIDKFAVREKVKKVLLNFLPVIVLTFILFDFTWTYGWKIHGITVGNLMQKPQTVLSLENLQSGSGEPYRVFSFLPGFSMFEATNKCTNLNSDESFEIQKNYLPPNISMLYGVDIIDGYDNFMPVTMSNLLAKVGSELSLSKDNISRLSTTTQAKVGMVIKNKSILRMMNTKYVLSIYPFQDSDFILRDTVDISTKNCSLSPIFIYELKGVFPRFFGTDSNVSLDSIIKNADIYVPEYEYYGYNIDLKSSEGYKQRGKKISEPYYFYSQIAWLPDWKAYIDDNEVKIEKFEDYSMRVLVPNGSKKISFVYKSPVNIIEYLVKDKTK